jgi:hypothetical protein
MTGELRVGSKLVSFDKAQAWARAYLGAEANRRSSKPFAFPAYDDYNAEDNRSNDLTDADLLAPVLLNVGISIRSFYGLQRLREPLAAVLRDVADQSLTEASAKAVTDLVSRTYGVLDDPDLRPSGVGATKLSKVLHRKRPEFFVLHDKQVKNCYWGTGAVPAVKRGTRTWAEYMVQVSLAIRDDLVTQSDAWERLRVESAPEVARPVSLLRLLDIVAWHAGTPSGISDRPSDDDDDDQAV